jgi:Thrombospondin type 3 repeat
LRSLARLAVALLALSAWPAAAHAAGLSPQNPELLNQPGTPLGTSYSRNDNNSSATVESPPSFFCGDPPVWYSGDVWYQIHPQANGQLSMFASSSDFFPVLAIWAVDPASGNPSDPSTCNTSNDFAQTPLDGIDVQGGKIYDIQIGSQCIPSDCSAPSSGAYSFSLSYDPDTDGDGVLDSADLCKTSPGPQSNHGCPDTDGDGLPDNVDACPGTFGPQSNHGCPLPPPNLDGDALPDSGDRCPTLTADIHYTYPGNVTKISQIWVTQVPAGSTVTIRCKGRHCFRGRTLFERAAQRKVVLVRNKTVARGDSIQVQVTAPEAIGAFKRIKIPRHSRRPSVSERLCLQPGSPVPTGCPS